ncbi:META domain-containing protein [Hanstruepera neustonica]|uniref:META domain-containing protein n=1 Tax=Hanstruepera neustonica TaxID=1445657 RepID=A0A2K1E1B4_9FLAO|nr:META domain-containing protein [Hanstruepera neustonica]PNQ74053.1 META domain-containing protein [Hanstruepera neustonica]
MKTIQLIFVSILCMTLGSCNQNAKTNNKELYDVTWELEYISGPRIAFEGLYPDRKPQITFNQETKKVTGNNSCNGYSADYTLEGNAISFGEPGPSTLMYCGEGENVFLKTMKQITKFTVTDGKLNLMLDDVTMMRFHKID